MNEWYISRGEGQEGPLTAEQVAALLAQGTLKANEDHAWKEGMAEWKTLSESGVLSEASLASAHPAPSLSATNTVPQSTLGNQNIYAAPQTAAVSAMDSAAAYPGIGRLGYFLWYFFGTIAFYIILFAAIFSANSNAADLMMVIAFIAIIAATVLGMWLGVKRLQNLGMSGWAVLIVFVPFLNLWIGWRMMACPAGYHDHRQLDTTGKVLTGLFIGFFVLAIFGNVVGSMITASR